MERFVYDDISMRNGEDRLLRVNLLIEKYMMWKEREKWLLLRKVAYQDLRNRFFSSSEGIDDISAVDFKRHYLSFGIVSISGFKYKLTVGTIPSFLGNYSVSRLEDLIVRQEIEVVGNASWSQLHMGFRKEKWQDMKKGVKYLLFGDRKMPLSHVEEGEVINRLNRVLEGDLAVKGFGRAKVTPLLLICDDKDRFCVWNSVSDEALHELKLKYRSDITKNRSVSEYLQANRALKKLKVEYGFKDLSDVDLFAWYFLKQTKPPTPSKIRRPPQVISIAEPVKMFEEMSKFEKEIRAFIFEKLYEVFSDFWIVQAIPKKIGMNWQERREHDIKEGKPPERNLINYADFSDYKEIIIYNWKNVFSNYFKDKEKLRVRLDDLNNLCRKTTMHARTITEDEIGMGKISIRWLRSKMKNLQTV